MHRSLLRLVLFFCAANAMGAEHSREPGAMLREGTWTGDVGTYMVPDALTNVKPSRWPVNGWYSLTIREKSIESRRVVAPRKGAPAFLQAIITQVKSPQVGLSDQQTQSSSATEGMPDTIYFRLPASRLREGVIPSHIFQNGTSTLHPKLDHRYELELDGKPFAFVVRNGFRGKNGASYGEGARYTIEYDGRSHDYTLGEFGWDSTVIAITDLDADGKPDFIIRVGVSNGGYEAILLSSKAKPGKNPATASLSSSGC